MTSRDQTSWPVPLRRRDIGLGEAVREYARNTETSANESAAYGRMLRHLARRPRPGTLLVAGFGLGMTAALLAMMVVSYRSAEAPTQNRATVITTLPTPPSPNIPRIAEVPKVSTPPATTVRLASSALVLPTGRVKLVDEGWAMVPADTEASGRKWVGHTEIALAKGSIELHVLPRAAGHELAVSAGGYRFVVVGTTFTVSRTETRLHLRVNEGRVEVWRGRRRLATVGAGEQWSVPSARFAPPQPGAARVQAPPSSMVAVREPRMPATPVPTASRLPATNAVAAAAPTPASPVAPALPDPEPAAQAVAAARRDCGAIVGRNPTEAMGCYRQQAAQGGLAGEAARYEMARLWRDTFHDPARALAAFKEQRAQFPRGVLAIEADLSIIELLPRLDRHAEALAESERFLKEHPNAERRGEIRLLRGNIYREALRDFEHAEREYHEGAESRGRAGDECRFLRAVCLEALGRTKEARKAYETYLSQPKAAHAQEVKERLDRLGP
jgi:hypothetical protein